VDKELISAGASGNVNKMESGTTLIDKIWTVRT
jgi:hypothetical protein